MLYFPYTFLPDMAINAVARLYEQKLKQTNGLKIWKKKTN